MNFPDNIDIYIFFEYDWFVVVFPVTERKVVWQKEILAQAKVVMGNQGMLQNLA